MTSWQRTPRRSLEHLDEEALFAGLEVAAAPESDFLHPGPEAVQRTRARDDPAVLVVPRDPGVPAIDHRVVDDDRALLPVAAQPLLSARQGETVALAGGADLDEGRVGGRNVGRRERLPLLRGVGRRSGRLGRRLPQFEPEPPAADQELLLVAEN